MNDLHAGECFLLRPGDRPRGRHDPASPLVVFAGHFEIVEPAWVPAWAPGPVRVGDLDALQAAIHLLLHFQQNDAVGLTQALQQLLRLLGSTESEDQRSVGRRRLRRVTQAIERDLARPWRIEDLSQLAALSRAQLHRAFIAAYGLAPMGYVAIQRMERAKTLLRESGMSLEQIAEALGHCDVHYFSRQFLRYTGQRPGAFRRDAA